MNEIEEWQYLHYFAEMKLNGNVEIVAPNGEMFWSDIKYSDWLVRMKMDDDGIFNSSTLDDFKKELDAIDMEIINWDIWTDNDRLYMDIYINKKPMVKNTEAKE